MNARLDHDGSILLSTNIESTVFAELAAGLRHIGTEDDNDPDGRAGVSYRFAPNGDLKITVRPTAPAYAKLAAMYHREHRRQQILQ